MLRPERIRARPAIALGDLRPRPTRLARSLGRSRRSRRAATQRGFVVGGEVPAGVAADSGRAVESARATGRPWAIASTAGMPKLSQVEEKAKAVASA